MKCRNFRWHLSVTLFILLTALRYLALIFVTGSFSLGPGSLAMWSVKNSITHKFICSYVTTPYPERRIQWCRSKMMQFICNSTALTLRLFGIWFQWFEFTVSVRHVRIGKSHHEWIDSQDIKLLKGYNNLMDFLFSFMEGLGWIATNRTLTGF